MNAGVPEARQLHLEAILLIEGRRAAASSCTGKGVQKPSWSSRDAQATLGSRCAVPVVQLTVLSPTPAAPCTHPSRCHCSSMGDLVAFQVSVHPFDSCPIQLIHARTTPHRAQPLTYRPDAQSSRAAWCLTL